VRTTTPAEVVERELAELAPDLVDGFRAALPAAADVVGRRLRGALHREGLRRDPGYGRRHAFGRTEFADAPADPAALLDGDAPGLAAEITDAVVNLAVALARRTREDRAVREAAAVWTDVLGAGLGSGHGSGHGGGHGGGLGSVTYSRFLRPDERVLFLERLATEGHNLHPCGRTRLGWRTGDLLAHDLESAGTEVGFVAVRADVHTGDDVGALLRAAYPGQVPQNPPGYVVQPVHAWQLDRLPERYDRALVRRLDAVSLPAAPTAALRTLLLPPGEDDVRRYLKLSLDIQVTSTRRTISVASTRNGPAISALLHRLVDRLVTGDRLLLMAEEAGAALDVGPGADRDAAAIVRLGLGDRLDPGEAPVPAVALPARCPLTGRPVLAELVDAYAASTGTAGADAAAGFLDDYAALLLPPVLDLATRYGVGLEAHLQNCVPTFRRGVPHRMALRDFAGLRLHLPRLRARGAEPGLWPGSVIATDDVDALRAKVAYTALQAHLGELVVVLTGTHGLDEAAAWRRVRVLVDEVYAGLAADPAVAGAARADHAFLTAPTVPHKALVRMRLSAGVGDAYVAVENPLHG